MTTWKVVVWSTYRAPGEQVWQRLTEPAALAAAFPSTLAWDVPDADGLAAAWRGAAPATIPTMLRVGPATLPFTVRVTDAEDDGRCTAEIGTPLLARLLHRRRLEHAVGRRARVVDELVLTPRVGPSALVAALTAWALLDVHARVAADLDPDGPPSARRFALPPAKAAHAEDALAGLPRAGS